MIQEENNTYVMGVDPFGYDGSTSTVIVIKKTAVGNEIVCSYQGRPIPDLDNLVKKLTLFYKIPDNHIFKQL